VAVVLLLLLFFNIWRRYRKRGSDLENPRVAPDLFDEVCDPVSASFYPSARIVVVLTMGRKVILKEFERTSRKLD
jgi:hypothetical protein